MRRRRSFYIDRVYSSAIFFRASFRWVTKANMSAPRAEAALHWRLKESGSIALIDFETPDQKKHPSCVFVRYAS
jgi:hypothetical protein